MKIHPHQLIDTTLLGSSSFHFLEEPSQIVHQINELLDLREKAGINGKPLIIWEPLPSSCTPDNLNAFCNAARSVDVLSPNHVELAGIVGKYEESLFEKDLIEELALAFLQSGVGESAQGAVVVRAGEHGCLVQSNDQPARWLPA